MKTNSTNLLIISIAAITAGCTGTVPENSHEDDFADLTGKITLKSDKAFIKSDGTDAATFRVMLSADDGNQYDVTPYVDIYCDNSSHPIANTAFTSSETGEYNFYAVRGFDISNTLTIKAMDGIMLLPTDPRKDSYSFSHRMMLIQHTGTECPNCPRMMNILKTLSADEDYASAYYHVAAHSYTPNDPAYSSAAVTISRKFNPDGWFPWLTYDLTEVCNSELNGIKQGISLRHKDAADAGISAACTAADGHIYANIGIKIAKTNSYRIAVWVLEDGIYGAQSGATASWQNTHNNCLRHMTGNGDNECIYGKSLGKMKGGETGNYVATIEVDNSWNLENCKVMAILTSDDGTGNYALANCTVCQLEETVAYEYVR